MEWSKWTSFPLLLSEIFLFVFHKDGSGTANKSVNSPRNYRGDDRDVGSVICLDIGHCENLIFVTNSSGEHQRTRFDMKKDPHWRVKSNSKEKSTEPSRVHVWCRCRMK